MALCYGLAIVAGMINYGRDNIMLSLNRIDNSIEYYGERIGTLDNGYNAYDAFVDIESAYQEAMTIEDKIIEVEEKAQSEALKTGWNDAIDKIQYDLDCFLDSILDHSERDLTEEFKDELYKGIIDIIENAKNV